MFIHLHNHSHYSILEWLPKPKDYVKKAKELWMIAVALTDTSNLHWCHEFYKECKSNDIIPILWTEIYVQSSLDEKINHKLVLLAKNLKWYQNIIQLTSKASLDNPWVTPFVAFDSLKEFNSDIICLSWPIWWEIPYFILSWKSDEEILKRINEYREVFWKDNYYLELMYHDDIPKQSFVTDKLIELHKKYNISVVATNNCFYIDPEDKNTQDVIMALWTWHEVENPDRPTLINWNYSFLSEEDMQMQFGFIPSALENTEKIAKQINIEIETGWILIPTFELPDEHQRIYEEALEVEKNDYYQDGKKWNKEDYIQKLTSDEWYLRYLSFEWLNWRYDYKIPKDIIFKLVQKLDKPSLDKKLTETSPEELKSLSLVYYSDEKKKILSEFSKEIQDKITRLEYELVVVNEMWFNAYFLIVADYINWARDNDIPVWPWRWSAAGSLMAFLSGITDIDPLPFWLLFERFLNPARVSMPDIDTDFSDDARDKVISYCREKYWADKVAQICTFGTFAARAAVKDVWRVMWVSFADMNELVKTIPEKPWTKLKWALEDSPEFKDFYDNNPLYKKIIDNALKIEWNVRQLWVHACAVIIAPESMLNFTALQHPPKDPVAIVTQYSAYPLEDLGLLKMDFLWLRNLTIIKRTVDIIKETKWDDIDILRVDLNDPKVFEVFAAWDTTWVFQFESDWMRKYLKDLWPDTFEDLIAMVSLYRPGPLAYIPTFIDVKYWRQELKYMTDDLIDILQKAGYSEEEIAEEKRKLDEDLWPILDVSYWIAVYQEQLMFIVQYMAGFSLWEADLLRRWVWKKKLDVVEALKKEFMEKWATYKWYKPETTNYIYTEMIMPAANYSFNKSHAACYAFIAYQTAYLKAYYPTEFLVSVMTSDEENMERITLEVWEAESKWINVLPPSVNESLKHFTYIDDNNIRFWLKAIKWIWDWPIDAILEARKDEKFKDLDDFISKWWKDAINKKSLEALILSWAMDEFWSRWQLYASIPNIIQFLKRDEKKKQSSQIWLFDLWSVWWDSEFNDNLELEDVEDFSFEEKLKWEKEMMWFRVSGHPLDWLSRYCAKRSNNIKKLKMDFDELLELDKKENPEKYEEAKDVDIEKIWKDDKTKKIKKDRKQEIVQAVGVVWDVRKIITKTWKNMMFFNCEWFDYDFDVAIFDRDYDKYKDRIKEDSIVIVNGNLSINFEFKRKSIQSRDIKIATLSQIREQAMDLWLFDWVRVNKFLQQTNEVEESNDESVNCNDNCIVLDSNFDWELDEKIINNDENITEFIVGIPKNAKKEDLLELKNFLLTEVKWNIEIFINLSWKKITTKISIKDLSNLKKWIKNKWN